MGRSSRQRREERRRRELEAAASVVSAPVGEPKKRGQWRIAILKALPLGVFIPMMAFFGSVGPDDFAKNYANWARVFGLSNQANWLAQYATGPRVFWGTIFVSIIYLIVAFGIPFLIKRRNATTIVPIIIMLILVAAGYTQYELGTPPDRHITEAQRAKLKRDLAPSLALFTRAIDFSASDNREARTYAVELMTALGLAGLTISSQSPHMPVPGTMLSYGNIHGVFIQVADPKNPPEEAKILAAALSDAGIPIFFAPNLGFWIDNYILTVGDE